MSFLFWQNRQKKNKLARQYAELSMPPPAQGGTPAQQKALVEAAREAGAYQRQLNADNVKMILDGVRKAGMEVVEKVDLQPFADAAKPVRDGFAKQYGDTYLKKIDAAR